LIYNLIHLMFPKDSLLTTKLYLPSTPLTIVPRPRLLELVTQALKRPLTLISAPAGFGKTTLLREWRLSLAGGSFPLAWLTLDNDDNDPNRFLRYLFAALQTIHPGLDETSLAALQLQQTPPTNVLLTPLINEISSLSVPFALVLDDYHVITSPSVHEILRFLLDHLPPVMHLVLLTRADPPLPLPLLRARGQLTEIRALDLRFLPGEAEAFLNEVMGLGLSKVDIAALEARTEGWIAGLQLAALSLRHLSDKPAFVAAFAGDDRHVMDYLLQEVLQVQTPEVQAFLLQTSILDRLCGPLCEAVTGFVDSQTTLIYLEQANLFVTPLDNRRTWYRYHRLFADLLRNRLRQSMPSSDYLALVQRACTWYEQQGLLVEAVSQAFTAPELEHTARLLERHVLALFFSGQTMLVHRWLENLPEALLRAHPLLCAVYANTLVHSRYFDPQALPLADYWLQAAEQPLQESLPQPGRSFSSDSPAENVTRSFIALSRAYLASWRGEPPAAVIVLAQRALATLPPADEPGVSSDFLRFHSGLNFNLGMSFLGLGDEEAASRAFAQAQKIGQACGDFFNAFAAVSVLSRILCRRGRLPESASLCQAALQSIHREVPLPHPSIPSVGMLDVALGLILLEWNDLDAAEQMLVRGLELGRWITGTDIQLQGCVALSRLRCARRDFKGALDALDQVVQARPTLLTLAASFRIRCWLQQGNREAAVQWAQGRQFSDALDAQSLTLARTILAQPQASPSSLPGLGALLQYLDRQIQVAEARGWVEWMIELLILSALARQAQKDIPTALDALQSALALAEPGGYVRLFVDEGAPMRQLLVRLKESRGRSKKYISRLLAAWEGAIALPSSTFYPQSLVEPLSARELQVLRLLAVGHSNAEIAHQLVISLNTTKKHLTHIFEKLDVTNRADAVARARALGWVA